MEKSLNLLKPGQQATITRITGEGVVRRRLMDMGLTRGTQILIRKVAPLGDPIEVCIRGYELTFRKSEAKKIFVL